MVDKSKSVKQQSEQLHDMDPSNQSNRDQDDTRVDRCHAFDKNFGRRRSGVKQTKFRPKWEEKSTLSDRTSVRSQCHARAAYVADLEHKIVDEMRANGNQISDEAEEDLSDVTPAFCQKSRRFMQQQQQQIGQSNDRTSNRLMSGKRDWRFQRRNGRPSSAQFKHPRNRKQKQVDSQEMASYENQPVVTTEDAKDSDQCETVERVMDSNLPTCLNGSDSSSAVEFVNLTDQCEVLGGATGSNIVPAVDGRPELLTKLSGEVCEASDAADDDDQWEDVDETVNSDDDDDDDDELLSADENGENELFSDMDEKTGANGDVDNVEGSADLSEYVSPCDSVENLDGQLDSVPSPHQNVWSDEVEAVTGIHIS
jgi:hypothetical protein